MKNKKNLSKDSLGDRMKNNYESRSKTKLNRRTPVIIRLDGKAFHTFTKNFEKPFDKDFLEAMYHTTWQLLKNIQGCIFAYTQSDEISLLLQDYEKIETDAWFDYDIQKLTSVSASMATAYFNESIKTQKPRMELPLAFFDSRAFNIPENEIENYFYWRLLDCERNSVQGLAQSIFSHKDLHKKNISNCKEMLKNKKVDWECLRENEKYGKCFFKDSSGFLDSLSTRNIKILIEEQLDKLHNSLKQDRI